MALQAAAVFNTFIREAVPSRFESTTHDFLGETRPSNGHHHLLESPRVYVFPSKFSNPVGLASV
jgi:hypothetical protein